MTKINPIWLLIAFLPLASVGNAILSESFSGSGYMEAWHDSEKVTDRTTAQGRYDYAAELYPGGVSSGLNVTNGSASYAFQSGDYSVRLKKFAGQVVAEADTNGTIIDLYGSGEMVATSWPNWQFRSSVRPFPVGGLVGIGEINLSVTTEFENRPIEMWNGTEWADTPVTPINPIIPGNETPTNETITNQTTNETIVDPDDPGWIDENDWDDNEIIFL